MDLDEICQLDDKTYSMATEYFGYLAEHCSDGAPIGDQKWGSQLSSFLNSISIIKGEPLRYPDYGLLVARDAKAPIRCYICGGTHSMRDCPLTTLHPKLKDLWKEHAAKNQTQTLNVNGNRWNPGAEPFVKPDIPEEVMKEFFKFARDKSMKAPKLVSKKQKPTQYRNFRNNEFNQRVKKTGV